MRREKDAPCNFKFICLFWQIFPLEHTHGYRERRHTGGENPKLSSLGKQLGLDRRSSLMTRKSGRKETSEEREIVDYVNRRAGLPAGSKQTRVRLILTTGPTSKEQRLCETFGSRTIRRSPSPARVHTHTPPEKEGIAQCANRHLSLSLCCTLSVPFLFSEEEAFAHPNRKINK